jgi:hypothetical protein
MNARFANNYQIILHLWTFKLPKGSPREPGLCDLLIIILPEAELLIRETQALRAFGKRQIIGLKATVAQRLAPRAGALLSNIQRRPKARPASRGFATFVVGV